MCGLLSWPEEGFCRGATESLHTPVKCSELPERDQDRTVKSHTCKWFPLSWGLGWWGELFVCLRIKDSLSFVLYKSQSAAILECTRGFNNRNTLCAHLSSRVWFVKWETPQQEDPANSWKTSCSFRQMFCIDALSLFLKKAAFFCLCPTLAFI